MPARSDTIKATIAIPLKDHNEPKMRRDLDNVLSLAEKSNTSLSVILRKGTCRVLGIQVT